VVELVTVGECFCNAIGWTGMGRCGAASRTRHDLHFLYRADGMRNIGSNRGGLIPRIMLGVYLCMRDEKTEKGGIIRR
jgi:hypothetical protein